MHRASECQTSQVDEVEIRRALGNGEFFYVYQPKVDIATSQVCGAEALLRWDRHGETIYPDDFIPIAEKSSLVSEITNTMLPTLINDIQTIDHLSPGLTTSFNACSRDFIEGDMTMTVVQAIVDGKLRRGNLRIEVTETTLASNIESLDERFQVLLDAGVMLAMDDLGKGYSSLDLLAKLPFTCLKIDKDMVGKLGTSRKAEHIVASICELGKKLGLTLIAEGVGSRHAFAELSRLGCDQAQGYWVSPPLPLREYLDFVRHSQPWGRAKLAA